MLFSYSRFCKFRFLGDPHIHESFSRDLHGPKLRFNTRHLVLPGLIDEDKLCEDLLRKDFRVEVITIDFKNRYMIEIRDFLMTCLNWQVVIIKFIHFSEIGTDGKIIANTNAIAPYGIAEFDLSELATGVTNYESTAQIIPCEFRRSKKQKSNPLGGPESLPPAQWLENFASLTLSISLPYSILTKSIHFGSSCTFGYFTRLAILAE